ncbi:pyrroline-5-carboxylate reductase [uncultured Amnibacterium sp.]|uniref:pyrroline-5-carboxylate reductase n=1 Tax=uncultured Amnibacterium sp. TaxID=1631851 RepID=UPI0035CB3867
MSGAIAILGGGSMGGAIAAGALSAGTTVRMTTRSAARAAAVAPRDGLSVAGVEDDPRANSVAVREAAIVVIAVKPPGVLALLDEIAADLPAGAAVVSVAAGVPIRAMAARLQDGTAVLRAMPNTPAAIGAGVTGLAAGPSVSRAAADSVRDLFRTTGTVIELPEERIDALSAISGSGPAYVYYFVEQLLGAAERLGFSPEQSRQMVLGTVRGSVRLLDETGDGPAELRRRVTSPGGTTERAVAVFAERDLGGIVDDAFAAAIARSAELARVAG